MVHIYWTGFYPKRIDIRILNRHLHSHLIHSSQVVGTSLMSLDGLID